jgi:hypothetical protein
MSARRRFHLRHHFHHWLVGHLDWFDSPYKTRRSHNLPCVPSGRYNGQDCC